MIYGARNTGLDGATKAGGGVNLSASVIITNMDAWIDRVVRGVVDAMKRKPRKNAAAVALGRAGGLKRSKAKADAARTNGAKGGRPMKRRKSWRPS